MADLLVGIAKSVVDGALTKAQAAIEEEAKLRQSAQRNLVFITGEFQMMQSFLKVADNERLKNVVVMTWVRQIRDLAYDVEDCIEFVVHLDKRKRWWVKMLQPGRWIMPCIPPFRLDEAVADLERLKARVVDVSSRNTRYSLISDSGSKLAAAEHQLPSHDAVDVGVTAFDRFFIAAGTEKGNLTDLVSKKETGGDHQVIAVWGSSGGDLGMTSVVWNAYTDKEICEGFPCRAWIKLRRPFSPQEFVRSLASQFSSSMSKEQRGGIITLDVLDKIMEAKQGELLAEFVQHVNKVRFLVVLEDLSSMEEWNAITQFFPRKGEHGSCIIVSTLNFEVARLSVGYPYRVLHLHQLSAQHSVYGFYNMETQRDGDKGKKIVDPVPSRSRKKKAAELWMKEHPLVGRESETKELSNVYAVNAARTYQVVSVWGIAGVGKSSLVKHMFCDKILQSPLFKKFAWVDLSHPFNIWDFSRSLLLSFHSEDLQTKVIAEHGIMESKNPVLECREMLQSEHYLIVIDGLQSTTEWDSIAELLLGSKKKKAIVVIASEESIATHCCGPEGPYTYNVKGLGPRASSDLFAKASKDMQSSNVDVRGLIPKCGGLPKVIVEISELLARKKYDWKVRACCINNQFIQELKKKGEFSRLQELFCWMQLYFRNCPDSLKPCILYLSIFPPNLVIRRRRLVRRWIAEGYSIDSHEESAEERGEKQFHKLLSLSIIQEPSSLGLGDTKTRIVSCQVNGFFREYIVSQRMEENLVFELDGHCAVTTQRTGRHLCISKDWDRDRIVFKNIDFSRLRSLTVSGEWKLFFVSESMKLLRVLDLEDASGVKCSDLEKILKQCPRIKFLSLRRQTEICHLPSSIGDLRQLQTLDVRHTSIKTLPVNITKLENLQYIRAGNTSTEDHKPSTQHLPLSLFSDYCRTRHIVGVQMRPGIRKLTALHTLGVVDISASGTKAISELKNITQLCKLGVSGVNKSNSKMFFSAISNLVHLESLSVWLDKDSPGCLDDIFPPRRACGPLNLVQAPQGQSRPEDKLPEWSLRSIKLHGLGDKLPEWRELFTKLRKIDLEMTKVISKNVSSQSKEVKSIAEEGVMVFLSKLSELCILRIRVQKFKRGKLDVNVMTNGVEDESFKNVKILEIACSSSAEVTFGKKTMKKLQQLKVDCSIGSRYKFAGLELLPQLKEVCVKGSDDDALKQDIENQLKNNQNKPVLNWTNIHQHLDPN